MKEHISNYDKLLEAFGEKKVKTKHLKQKAEKKAAQKKLTRKMKIDRALKRQESLKSLRSRCAYNFKHLREVNAADHEFVVRIKKLESKLNQILS